MPNRLSRFVRWSGAAALCAGLASPIGAQIIGDNAEAVASDLDAGHPRVVFRSQEQLVPEDADAAPDIYVRLMPATGPAVTELVTADDTGFASDPVWVALGARNGLVWARAPIDGNGFVSPLFVFVRGDDGVWRRATALDTGDFVPLDILDDGSVVVSSPALGSGFACELYRVPRPGFIRPPGTKIGIPVPRPPEQLTASSAALGECPRYGGGFVTPAGGVRIVYTTKQPVNFLDRDATDDVYMKTEEGTRWISRPADLSQVAESPALIPARGNPVDDFGDFVSPEADTVIFRSTEQLVAADTDQSVDFYVGGFGQVPILVPGNGVPRLVLNGFVFFESTSRLAGNLDDDVDVFRMSLASPSQIVQVSRSRIVAPNPFLIEEIGTRDAAFAGASDDGRRVWFKSRGHFGVPNPSPTFNGDPPEELYEADLTREPGSSGHLRRFTRSRADFPGLLFADVTTPATFGPGEVNSMFLGRTILFRSIRQLASVEEPGRGAEDLYAFGVTSAGRLQVVTTPTDGPHPERNAISPVLGFGGTPFRGSFAALQPDRGHDPFTVIFETRKQLSPEDTDLDQDVYVHDLVARTTTLISTR